MFKNLQQLLQNVSHSLEVLINEEQIHVKNRYLRVLSGLFVLQILHFDC